ncbi:hypothetical protein PGT21_021713 [Puccinia graminis f. sp. tritici]|uniref:Uncharacterized protein n=1 Tax=Puccinia graminis f. sp. tritici TaxID=56615 RepID=A0A5B0N9A5_PUCGR|nr:hypothetical protein PGT21_021713 [Puccinia graminis f. sp. tritici]KAA1090373.1 hypothetical protein PGTUg99_003288 [Puccinia graminis f. sp. tritici]
MGGSRAIGDDYRLQHELSGSLSPYMEPRLATRFRAFSDADGVPILRLQESLISLSVSSQTMNLIAVLCF